MSYNYCHNSCKSSLWVRFWFAGMDWTLYMGGYRNGIVDISNLFFLPFDKTKIRFLHFPLFEIFALKQNLCKLQWVSDKARQKWSTLGLMKSLKDRKRSSIFWISGPNPYRPFVLLWVVCIHWLELPQLYHRGDEGATKEILQLCLPGLKLVVTTMTSGHLKFCQLCKFFQKTTCFLTIYPSHRHDLPPSLGIIHV